MLKTIRDFFNSINEEDRKKDLEYAQEMMQKRIDKTMKEAFRNAKDMYEDDNEN